jgi:RNA polymerase sigma-70 factor (family 1)
LTGTVTNKEKELFSRIAEGDEAAFEELFHLFVPRIQPVMQKMLRSEVATKDLIQDIFLSIWVTRDKLAAIESPTNWIFRIVYNRIYSWMEKQSVRQKAAAAISRQETIISNLTEENLAFAETSRLVQQAVQQLPNRTKEIYLLSREAGMKKQDIANQLGISVNTVKNTLANAGKSIKDYLEANGVSLPMILLAYWLH